MGTCRAFLALRLGLLILVGSVLAPHLLGRRDGAVVAHGTAELVRGARVLARGTVVAAGTVSGWRIGARRRTVLPSGADLAVRDVHLQAERCKLSSSLYIVCNSNVSGLNSHLGHSF